MLPVYRTSIGLDTCVLPLNYGENPQKKIGKRVRARIYNICMFQKGGIEKIVFCVGNYEDCCQKAFHGSLLEKFMTASFPSFSPVPVC